MRVYFGLEELMSLTITNIVFVGISSLSPSIGAVRLNSIYHFVRRVDTYLRTRYLLSLSLLGNGLSPGRG